MADSAHPVAEPGLEIPDHVGLVPDEIHGLIRRAIGRRPRPLNMLPPGGISTTVIGWKNDDLTEEEWTPPEGFYDDRRQERRKMVNHYLCVGEYAYSSTRPRVPMLNREHVSVQQATPTRRIVER